MLSTLLFSGLSQTTVAAFDNVQARLPKIQEPELRRADTSDVVLGSSLWATKGSSPMDGLVVYIRAQAEDTKYKMLSADGDPKGCFFKNKYKDSSTKTAEQLWKLESTGEGVGEYDYYFLRNLAHDDIRMSYFWDDANTNSPYLSMTCGKNMANRHHWIFEESSSVDSDDKSYQIVNRESGAQTYCRLTSEVDHDGNGVFSEDDEYVCSRGTSNMDHDSTLDTVYSFRTMMGWPTFPLVGACSNGNCQPQDTADGVRDFKLLNPYNSEAGWDVVAGSDIEVNGEVQWTYSYKTGISNTITSTSAMDSSYSVSVSASVGASAFGMDVSTEVATSFGQSFSSSYSSGITLDTATTVTLEILVPANTCVELLQLYSITDNDFQQASFQFKSNQLKLRCCIGTEDQNPEYCNSDSLAHRPSGEWMKNDFTGESSHL